MTEKEFELVFKENEIEKLNAKIDKLLMILSEVVSDFAAHEYYPEMNRYFTKYDNMLNEFHEERRRYNILTG